MLINYTGESKVIGRICELINTMTGVNFEVVQTLPTTDISTSTIYLVPKSDPGAENIYDEYINTDGTSAGWELIGTTEIDLSNYYTKSEVDGLIPTDFVPKSTGGTFEGDITVEEANSGSTSVDSYVTIGNNKAAGTTGCTRGVLEIYSGGQYRSRLFHRTAPTDNRFLYIPDKTGTVATTDDIVQSDWTESDNTKKEYIQNKPTLAAVATSGNYNDLTNTPTIPTDFVPKSTGGTFEGDVKIERTNAGTTSINSVLRLGNNIAEGTAGNTRGVLQLFDRNGNFTNIIASDNSSSVNVLLPKNKPSNSVLAITDDAEKVKQVYTQSTSGDFLLLASNSNSSSTSDETEKVKKMAHLSIAGANGNMTLCRKHTLTSVQNNIFNIGNNTPNGTEGAVDGVLRLYGKGSNYFQFYDGNNGLTADQTYRPRNRSGVLGLLNDIWDNSMAAQLGDFNLINPPYYHASGTYGALNYSSNEETGDYTVKGSRDSNISLNIKRYSQGFYLPAGAYKISGCPSGGSSDTYELRVYTSTEGGTTTLIGSDTGSGYSFQLKETSLMHIVFFIKANVSVDFTFRPTLKKITDWVFLDDLTSTAAKDINVQGVSEICVQLQPLGAKIISNIFSTRIIKANGSPSVPGANTGYPYQVGVYIQGTTISKEITARMKISNDILHIDCPDLNASNNERVTIYGKY